MRRQVLSTGGGDTVQRLWVSSRDLQRTVIGAGIPDAEQYRRYYGPDLDPAQIETALRAAECGHMRDLTALQYETISLDPHFASVIGKRFRAIAAIQPEVVPAEAPPGLEATARKYADAVRAALRRMRGFRRGVLQLAWARCHGRAALELDWVEERGRVLDGITRRPAGWSWIHPHRLSFGPERELRVRDDIFSGWGFEARGFDFREIPGKFITSTPQLFCDYPEREGFGPRGMYWSFFKRFGQRHRMRLLESFGLPWRIVYVDPAMAGTVSTDQLDAAADTVDDLGANQSARLPKGIRVQTEQPQRGAGEIHGENHETCNAEISKLVLGQTRTTDAASSGLGSQADEVAERSEGGVVAADALELSEDLTEQLALPIVLLNFGEEAAALCPRIVLPWEPPPDRGKETEQTVAALKTGVPLKRSEVYERIGFTEPAEGDDVVVQQTEPAPGDQGGAPDPLAEAERQLRAMTRRTRILRGKLSGSSVR